MRYVLLILALLLLASCGGESPAVEATSDQPGATPQLHVVVNSISEGLMPARFIVEEGAVFNVQSRFEAHLVNEQLGIDTVISAQSSERIVVAPEAPGTYVIECIDGCVPGKNTLTIVVT